MVFSVTYYLELRIAQNCVVIIIIIILPITNVNAT